MHETEREPESLSASSEPNLPTRISFMNPLIWNIQVKYPGGETPWLEFGASVLRHFGCVWVFVTLRTVACQASLSIGFSTQEYWSWLLCPAPGDLPDRGVEPISLMSPALADRFLPLAPPGKPWWEVGRQVKSFYSEHQELLSVLWQLCKFVLLLLDIFSAFIILLYWKFLKVSTLPVLVTFWLHLGF